MKTFTCRRYGTIVPKLSIFSLHITLVPCLVFACIHEDGWIRRGEYCYLYRGQEKTFSDAITECALFSADVIMPKSMDIINEVTGLWCEKIWIGLNGSENSVSLDDFRWTDGTMVNFSHWKDGETYDTDKLCTYMKDCERAEWETARCEHKHYPFVCQKLNVEDNCLATGTRSPSSDVCYHENGTGTYSEAVERCSLSNSEIVMPKTEEENEILARILQHRQISDIYIGLELDSSRTTFRWHGGEVLSFTHWDDGHHENWYMVASHINACVSMSITKSYKWYDSIVCNGLYTIMCQCRLSIVGIPRNPNYVYCVDMLEPSTKSFRDITFSAQSTEISSELNNPTIKQDNTSVNSILLFTILAYSGSTSSAWNSHESGGTSTALNHAPLDTISTFGQSQRITTTLSWGQNATNTNVCFEVCICNDNDVLTGSKLEHKLAYLKSNLTIDKANLSSTIRKLRCADDHRSSSKIMGYVGGAVILLVVGFFVFMDLLSLWKLWV